MLGLKVINLVTAGNKTQRGLISEILNSIYRDYYDRVPVKNESKL